VVSAIFSSAVDILSAEELRALNATKGPHGEFIQIIQFILADVSFGNQPWGKDWKNYQNFVSSLINFPFFMMF
jgi:hypothetical protein